MERELEGKLEGDSEGDFRGDFKQNMEGDLLSSSDQVRTRSGLVQVWFILQPKFNSFELDSEVGRLVQLIFLQTFGLHQLSLQVYLPQVLILTPR